jgi:dihydroorotate dehydrogenase
MSEDLMDKDDVEQLEPIYDYGKSFSENYAAPATHAEPLLAGVADAERARTLLGRNVGYPIGVPASPLTANAGRISTLAAQGLNVLTYKTVRSEARPAFPAPNWFFVKGLTESLPTNAVAHEITVETAGITPPDTGPYSMVNSFGMPSPDPTEWTADVREALESLRSDQLLIVSVVGTFERYKGAELLEDFVRVAQLAEETGVSAIELNLSCPNTLADEGKGMGPPICHSAKDTRDIVKAVKGELNSKTKLVAKLGYLGPVRLAEVVDGIAADVDAIAGINTLQVKVDSPSGGPAFRGTPGDPKRDRPKAGLSGVAIRGLALEFVNELARLRREREWTFDIIGMGGVMSSHDVRALMASGADAVQATCVVANNIRFAQKLIKEREALGAALEDERWTFRSAESLAEEFSLGIDSARSLLESNPDIARKTVMTDRLGRELYAARDRPATFREKLERLRWILAN